MLCVTQTGHASLFVVGFFVFKSFTFYLISFYCSKQSYFLVFYLKPAFFLNTIPLFDPQAEVPVGGGGVQLKVEATLRSDCAV